MYSSVHAPTYKISPIGSRMNSKDLRSINQSPKTPAYFSVKKINMTRESSVEEAKQLKIVSSK